MKKLFQRKKEKMKIVKYRGKDLLKIALTKILRAKQ